MKHPVILVLLIIISGCASENKDWENTKKENSIISYENFLKSHPEGIFADSARIHLEKLHFAVAESINTIQSYEDFVSLFPQGILVEKAVIKIDKLLPREPKISNIQILSTEEARCKVIFRLSVVRQSGTIAPERKPRVTMMVFCGEKGFVTTTKDPEVLQENPNHSVLNVELSYMAGSSCTGDCDLSIRITDEDGHDSNMLKTTVTFE